MEQNASRHSKFLIAITFLSLEVFAFLAFSFTNSFVFFGLMALVLAILLTIVSIKEIKEKGVNNFAVLFIPMVLFGVCTAFGAYMTGHVYNGDYTMLENVLVPLGLMAICFTGYLLAINKYFSLRTFLIVIFSALAVLVLINLFANLINFGAFYPLIYKDYYMYYAGKRSSVPAQDMAYTLEGLRIIEVNMPHYVLYPTLLLSSSFALFKYKYKTNMKMFLLYLSFTIIGVLALILVLSKYAIFSLVMVALVDLIIFLYVKFKNARKYFKCVFIGLVIAGSILFLILLLNKQSFASGISNAIASNSFLNKIFNNARIEKYSDLLSDVVGKNFLGFVVLTKIVGYPEEAHLAGSILFDTFMTSGVLGVACLIFYLVYGLKNYGYYFRNVDKDPEEDKYLLLSFILVFTIYSSFFNDGEYGIYFATYKPIYMSAPFMITIFMFAYITSFNNSAFVAQEEKVENV